MNIPLDRLYHYIRDTAQEIYSNRIIIYRFWPHGSKNISDLNNLNEGNNESLGDNEWTKKTIFPAVWCNDQEPLDYEFYKINSRIDNSTFSQFFQPPKNLNYRRNIFEKNLLLHSEKRSHDLKKYLLDGELIPVYYWSHAVIARDWFRYAEHERFQKNTKKTFLIYSRAWSGTREYRLKFADLLIKNDLVQQCQTSCNPIEPELKIHYTNHQFKNPRWKPTNQLENFLQPTAADATSSADFNTDDYNSTDIEVILETLFDDDRLHLTEKSLRPIACGQPFILTGTHGSLEYLRSYGFMTFNELWDESYDLVKNPKERLIRITDLMRDIADWTPEVREQKMIKARAIAEYNRQRFFSQDFFNLIINELKINLEVAFKELKQGNNYIGWINRWTEVLTYPEIIEYLKTNQNHKTPTQAQIDVVIKLIENKLNNSNVK